MPGGPLPPERLRNYFAHDPCNYLGHARVDSVFGVVADQTELPFEVRRLGEPSHGGELVVRVLDGLVIGGFHEHVRAG